ncbi:hypothetical protein NXS98_07635 [Fontisphaera persica]|uniref:hypothetical protein n=1 Tax=Fontisphaera persica TaxID=2974023 RepID=UPI0024BFB869|nr:hypothetical protein [Fontisphaera persica]WCJ60980.1 hypothetical protein NXS98_07635 [Fontisphaera persica]
MKHQNLFALIFACVCTLLFGAEPIRVAPEREYVSMIDVIANKSNYHNRSIVIKGYFKIRGETCAIFLSRDDALNGVTKNAIWFDIDSSTVSGKDIIKYEGKYVMVAGIYTTNRNGHLGLYSGEMIQVKAMRSN